MVELPAMTDTVRVRFAPSPTGNLHIGGARTALFNYLFARSLGGKFLLRIEDTDRERSRPEFTEDILGSLAWLGLDWDEEPVYQSHREARHQEVAEKLLSEGKAYHCYWSPEELNELREKARIEKVSFKYPGNKEKPSHPGPYPVRLKMPKDGDTVFQDEIRGEIRFPNADLDDWVIQRSDGAPTYNFVCVVDDSDQAITHVLRGEDHINNTPRQMNLYQALGLPVPKFAHLPMILGADRSKLSKRHGAASTLEYRKQGYLPEAVNNFLVRLGWSHGDQEVFSFDEMKKLFDLSSVGRTNAIFNPEKLDWVNGHFIREKSAAQLFAYLKEYFSDSLSFLSGIDEARVTRAIDLAKEKVKLLPELTAQLEVLFGADPKYPTDKMKAKDKELIPGVLKTFLPTLEASDFSREDLERRVNETLESQQMNFGPFGKSMRFATTANQVGIDLFEMLVLLGKDCVIRRVKLAEKALS